MSSATRTSLNPSCRYPSSRCLSVHDATDAIRFARSSHLSFGRCSLNLKTSSPWSNFAMGRSATSSRTANPCCPSGPLHHRVKSSHHPELSSLHQRRRPPRRRLLQQLGHTPTTQWRPWRAPPLMSDNDYACSEFPWMIGVSSYCGNPPASNLLHSVRHCRAFDGLGWMCPHLFEIKKVETSEHSG